jgi:hypothetical protein
MSCKVERNIEVNLEFFPIVPTSFGASVPLLRPLCERKRGNKLSLKVSCIIPGGDLGMNTTSQTLSNGHGDPHTNSSREGSIPNHGYKVEVELMVG